VVEQHGLVVQKAVLQLLMFWMSCRVERDTSSGYVHIQGRTSALTTWAAGNPVALGAQDDAIFLRALRSALYQPGTLIPQPLFAPLLSQWTGSGNTDGVQLWQELYTQAKAMTLNSPILLHRVHRATCTHRATCHFPSSSHPGTRHLEKCQPCSRFCPSTASG
jgi:hypothetical protein